MKTIPLIVLVVVLMIPVNFRQPIKLSSPNGLISYNFRLKNNTPVYSVSFRSKPIIIDSDLGLSFLGEVDFKSNLAISKPLFRNAEESYDLIVGKTKSVHDSYREVLIPLHEVSPPKRKINMIVRAFNDGLAFRYEFPEQKDWNTFSMTDENTTFRFAENPDVLALLLPDYTSSHEGRYSLLPLSEIKEDTLLDIPAVFEFPGPVYLSITEAALTDYAGMYLTKHQGNLITQLSPLPGQFKIKVEAQLPHLSPWRVLMISDRIGTFIESNILTSLNEPCKISDVPWIKPGKTTWPWWNGNAYKEKEVNKYNNRQR